MSITSLSSLYLGHEFHQMNPNKQLHKLLIELKKVRDHINYGSQITKVLKLAEEYGSNHEHALALNYHARFLKRKGDIQGALTSIDKALELASSDKNEPAYAVCLCTRADVLMRKSEFKQALILAQQALEISDKQNNILNSLDCHNIIGITQASLGNFNEAVKHFNDAVEITDQLNDRFTKAMLYNNIGNLYGNQGLYEKALEYQMRALKIREEMVDRGGTASSLNNIGTIYLTQCEYTTALEYLLKALDIYSELGDEYNVSSVKNNIAHIYKMQHNFEIAHKYFSEALEIDRRTGDKRGMVLGLLGMGNICLEQNNLEEAEEKSKEALTLAEESGSGEVIGIALNSLAEIYFKEKKYDKAIDYFKRALPHVEKFREDTVDLYLGMARCYIAKNEIDEGIKNLQSGLQAADELGYKNSKKEVLYELSEVLYKKGDLKTAYGTIQKAIDLEREIYNAGSAKKFAMLETRHVVEQKEKEAEIQRLKNVELKQAYDELKIAQEELVRKERLAAIGNIASEIAHEVQNPLNFVNNFSEVNIELVHELTDEIKKFDIGSNATEIIENLNSNSLTIKEHGRRASGIVSRLLELVRKGEA